MQFLGFELCPEKEEFNGIKIQVSPEMAGKKIVIGRSEIGKSKYAFDVTPDWEKAGKPTLQLAAKLFEAEKIAPLINTALHEFGHAAGLMHEHSRVDASKACVDYLESGGNEAGVKSFAKSVGGEVEKIGDYDEYSIMSYCLIDFKDLKNQIATLSNGDYGGLKALYPTKKIGLPQVAIGAEKPKSQMVATASKSTDKSTNSAPNESAYVAEEVVYCNRDLLTKCILEFGCGAGCLSTSRDEKECVSTYETGLLPVPVKSTSACIYSTASAPEKAACLPSGRRFR